MWLYLSNYTAVHKTTKAGTFPNWNHDQIKATMTHALYWVNYGVHFHCSAIDEIMNYRQIGLFICNFENWRILILRQTFLWNFTLFICCFVLVCQILLLWKNTLLLSFTFDKCEALYQVASCGQYGHSRLSFQREQKQNDYFEPLIGLSL